MKKNIVIKGEMQKNKSAIIAIVIGATLLVIAFFVALCIYNSDVNYRCFPETYYGPITIVGSVTLLVGIIIKISTELTKQLLENAPTEKKCKFHWTKLPLLAAILLMVFLSLPSVA